MTKVLNKIIWCNAGWFPVYFGFCPSEQAWNAEMKRLSIADAPYPKSDGNCSTFENKTGDLCILVTIAHHIDKDHDPNGIVGLLVHESAHVWQKICKHIGERKPSAEFEAYAMQGIAMSLIKAYSETRKPRFRL